MTNNIEIADLVLIELSPFNKKGDNSVYGIILKTINSDFGNYCHILYGRNKITYKYTKEIIKL